MKDATASRTRPRGAGEVDHGPSAGSGRTRTPRRQGDLREHLEEAAAGAGGRASWPVRAVGHDRSPEAVLVPFGVPESNRRAVPIRRPWFLSGRPQGDGRLPWPPASTSGGGPKAARAGVARLHVESDDGPEPGGSRTRFLKRVTGVRGTGARRRRSWRTCRRSTAGRTRSSGVEGSRSGTGSERCGRRRPTCSGGRGRRRGGAPRPIIRETTAVCEQGVRLKKAALRPVAGRPTRPPTPLKWSLAFRPERPG